MGWGNYGKGSGSSRESDKGWVEEGNVPIFMFSGDPVRCRFLTEDVAAEDVMQEQKVTREEAEDFIFTKLSQERWIMPRAYWEHQIKEIPGKRYFSTCACLGRGRCPMCAENDAAKATGINENKLLPYSVRKRFVVPAYFYELNRVLFVRAADEFFDAVADYVNKHGSDCDFDIYKVGKGLDTKYKAVFAGKSAVVPDGGYPTVTLVPRDVNLDPGEAEVARRMGGGKREQGQPAASRPVQAEAQRAPAPQVPAAQPAPAPAKADAAEPFRVPFGQHKGKTFDELVKAGNGEYVKFLADNSAGTVQAEAKRFLGLA